MLKPDSFANKECLLSNSSGAYGVTIAEHIIAVSLMMMRNLTVYHETSLNGKWALPRPQKSLKDATITVLGTGDIGTSFAHRAKAFEPKSVIGVCRSGKSEDPVYDKVLKVEELNTVLPETELLVMSLPATPETENILSKERIYLLPNGAYIVNVGRGSAIDEEALADALEGGKLAGAALDVFKNEPLPSDSRLWKTKNLLITPHVAGNLTLMHTMDKNVEMFCEDLLNFAAGKPLKHFVNRIKGY
jgi:phosphoglycerate dehydrogenase-like enzyme